MARMKLVFDPEAIEPATFKQGWAMGAKAAAAGALLWRPRLPLIAYWAAVWAIFACTFGLAMFFRLGQALAGAMRFEQLLMAGREARFSDAWGVFAKGGPLTGISALATASMLLVAGVAGSGLLGWLLSLALGPLAFGAWAMAAWRCEIQGEGFKQSVSRVPELVGKGWAPMLAMWIPLGLWSALGMAAALASCVGAAVAGAQWGMQAGLAAGAGALALTLAAVAALGSAQASVCGMGCHLLGRAMMMRRVEAGAEAGPQAEAEAGQA